MTTLCTTLYRKVCIGPKCYILGIHPKEPEPLLSIRPLGKRVAYVVAVSTIRVHAALAFGRAEAQAKREARKAGVKWQYARKRFLANLLPPDRKRSKKGKQ